MVITAQSNLQLPIIQVSPEVLMLSIIAGLASLTYAYFRMQLNQRDNQISNQSKQNEFENSLKDMALKDGENYREFIKNELEDAKLERTELNNKVSYLQGKLDKVLEDYAELIEVNNIIRQKNVNQEKEIFEKERLYVDAMAEVAKLKDITATQAIEINNLKQQVKLLEEHNIALESKIKELTKND